MSQFSLDEAARARCEQAVRARILPGIGPAWSPAGGQAGSAVAQLARWAQHEQLIACGPPGAELAVEFLPAGPAGGDGGWLASVTLGAGSPQALTLAGVPVPLHPGTESGTGAEAAFRLLSAFTGEANSILGRFAGHAVQEFGLMNAADTISVAGTLPPDAYARIAEMLGLDPYRRRPNGFDTFVEIPPGLGDAVVEVLEGCPGITYSRDREIVLQLADEKTPAAAAFLAPVTAAAPSSAAGRQAAHGQRPVPGAERRAPGL